MLGFTPSESADFGSGNYCMVRGNIKGVLLDVE